jgi:pimeloyl-ACP methyl ester carboxylesterase
MNFNMSELFANIKDIKLCYKIIGKENNYPVFFLHGFAMYKEFWIGQISELSKYFKLITFDIRSCGKSSHPIEPYEMDDFVEDLKGLMDFLKIEKSHIIGHSLGGMISQNFALKYPDRFNRLILLATIPKFPGDSSGLEMYKNSQLSGYKARLEDPVKAFYAKMKQRFTRNFFKIMEQNPKHKFHNIFSTEDLLNLEKINATSNERDIINLATAIAKHNTVDSLHQIKNKTLIIAGEKDRITPVVSSADMHNKIPNSTLKILKGGHFFPLEEAPEVNKIIISFLNT